MAKYEKERFFSEERDPTVDDSCRVSSVKQQSVTSVKQIFKTI